MGGSHDRIFGRFLSDSPFSLPIGRMDSMNASSVQSTRVEILDEAQRLVQTRGYDGFSYADIAEVVGIRKASIHHHFPAKPDLAMALIERFQIECRARFDAINVSKNPRRKLERYVELFAESLGDGRMCLCGMLAAGFTSLTDPVRIALVEALGEHENWLGQVIRDGQQSGLFHTEPGHRDQARALLASLEGVLMMARLHADPSRFRSSSRLLLRRLDVLEQ